MRGRRHTRGGLANTADLSLESSIQSALTPVFPYSESQCRAVAEKAVVQTCLRKELLHGPPRVCTYVALILSGSFRMYQVSDTDQESTLHFFTEGQWMADFESFVVQRPSNNYIQCLETAEIATFNIFDLHDLIHQDPAFMAMGRIMKDLAVSNRHITSVLNENPDERYRTLLQSHPDWVLRFPQIYLASYLGMTRETYSRVRNRIY